MSELFLPHTQYFFIRLVRFNLDRNAIGDLEPESLDRSPLNRMIGDETHSSNSEIVKYLCTYSIIPGVHLVNPNHRGIGFDRILVLLVHQAVGLELIDQSDPAALLFQVEQHAAPFCCDYFKRAMKLPAGIIAQRAEHITKHTLRMDAHRHA